MSYNPKDKYLGRQMYPKDTVTRKQMDRQDDRQTRRIDLWKEKHNRLDGRLAALEIKLARLTVMIESHKSEEE